MGYLFHKKDAEPFYIRLSDAGVVRAAASIEGLRPLMPETESRGGKIPLSDRILLASTFREQARVLTALADYFDGAEELRWGH